METETDICMRIKKENILTELFLRIRDHYYHFNQCYKYMLTNILH